jgi:hypothetical protein
MVEAGLELGDELVIPGALGEILDRDWHYLEEIRAWMDWEKTIVANAPDKYSELRTTFLPVLPLPGKILYRHEISFLVNSLSLPFGWEAHVAIDERSPAVEHEHHMRASLEFLRQNPVSAMRLAVEQSPELVALSIQTNDPTKPRLTTNYINKRFRPWLKQKSSPDDVDEHISLLDPFIRNIWLIRLEDDNMRSLNSITVPLLLRYSHWGAVLSILMDYEEHTKPALRVARIMNGIPVDDKTPYTINLLKSMKCIGCTNAQFKHAPDHQLLRYIYSRLITFIPEDASISAMGLEPIIGIKQAEGLLNRPPKDPNVTHFNNTSISDIVPWVNATIITYPRWYTEKLQSTSPESVAVWEAKNTILLTRDSLAEIVPFIADTLGLGVMRRMLLCLLHYVVNTEVKPPRKVKGVISDSSQAKYDEKLRMIERAELFASMLEKYLEDHEGEDEGVKTLEMGSHALMKEKQKYYW